MYVFLRLGADPDVNEPDECEKRFIEVADVCDDLSLCRKLLATAGGDSCADEWADRGVDEAGHGEAAECADDGSEDMIFLKNRDEVPGKLKSMDGRTVVINSLGADLTIPLERITRVALTKPEARPEAKRPWEVQVGHRDHVRGVEDFAGGNPGPESWVGRRHVVRPVRPI